MVINKNNSNGKDKGISTNNYNNKNDSNNSNDRNSNHKKQW